jgi:glycosyltransferase involved in cell wall biosynthesis
VADREESEKLRLCFVADLFCYHNTRWIDYFARKGHSILVLSPTGAEMPGVKVMKLFRTPTLPKLLQLLNVFVVLRAVISFRPHVLHAHYARIYGWLAALAFFKPLVVTVWGGDILEDQGAFSDFLGRKLTPFAIKRADMVTAHSGYLRDRVISLRQRPERVKMVGCPGVDRSVFRPGLETDALRTELGLGDCPVVLCPRLIDRLYNTETIVRAIPEVLREVPAAKFLFTALAGNAEYINQMKQLTQSLGVQRAAVFLDMIPREQMPLFLNMAKVFVSIPSSDGMPQSLLEAIACGTPAVVSALAQYRGVIEHDVNGLVVDQKDVRVVAAAVVRLLKEEGLRLRLSRALLNTTAECMDYHAEMAKMEAYYYELKGARPPRLNE